LRIATELYLKRLIVGGMERVYEIGRIWRNEGIDRTHNPEFTMLELYAAFWNVRDMMSFNEDLMAHLARSVHGSETALYRGDAISFATPFRRLGYLEAFEIRRIIARPAARRRCLPSPVARLRDSRIA